MATPDWLTLSGFRDMFISFFQWMSKGTQYGSQVARNGTAKSSHNTNDGSSEPSHSVAPVASALLPIKISCQPEIISESATQESQYPASRKYSADKSGEQGATSVDRKIVDLNATSHFHLPPSALTPASPTATYSTLSPSSTLFSISPPNSPGGSRRSHSHPSVIREESLDLSCLLTLASPSPIFEGTYSDVYKGNCQGREAGAFLMWLIDTYSI
jgi:hypothetical protein